MRIVVVIRVSTPYYSSRVRDELIAIMKGYKDSMDFKFTINYHLRIIMWYIVCTIWWQFCYDSLIHQSHVSNSNSNSNINSVKPQAPIMKTISIRKCHRYCWCNADAIYDKFESFSKKFSSCFTSSSSKLGTYKSWISFKTFTANFVPKQWKICKLSQPQRDVRNRVVSASGTAVKPFDTHTKRNCAK